jgi:SAM-dependent methyltransferase
VKNYHEDYFYRYSEEQAGEKRKALFFSLLHSVEKIKTVRSLLDVGCGCGYFMIAAQKKGWQVKGIDPSRQSAEVAQKLYGLDVVQGTLKDLHCTSVFDVITFINSLEHSKEPWRELKIANRFLAPGGLILIRSPNAVLHSSICRLSSFFRISKQIHPFLVFHQYSFTPKFLRKILWDFGFPKISLTNSPMREGDPNRIFSGKSIGSIAKIIIRQIASGTEKLSGGKLLLSPSLCIMAEKKHVTD